MNFRVGNGYDAHPLVRGESLILGGVAIVHNKGTQGYSDGDVLVHSIIDSILGALGIGDVGHLFPSNEEKYKNISSLKLLDEVVKIMFENSYKIINSDSTIILEKPILKDYIQPMKESISKSLKTAITQISIKATTTDQLGFVGREEGIAVISNILIQEQINKNKK